MELFPFQQEPVDKFTGLPYCLIAYDMGTGKSYIGTALDMAHRKGTTGAPPTLVICLRAVGEKWQDLFEAEGYETSLCNPKDREAFLAVKADLYIVHWQAVRLLQNKLAARPWFHIIGDEIQAIQSRKSQTSTATKSIKRVEHRTGLSGTVANMPDRLWSPLNWMDKKKYSSYWRFYNQYVQDEEDFFGFKHIVGPKNEDKFLAEIEPFYARKLKSEVMPDLPEKYYSTMKVDLSPKQRKAYDDMRKRMISWIGPNEDTPLPAPIVVTQLMRLQQFSDAYCEINDKGEVRLSEPSSKLDLLVDTITSYPNKQFVVFSQFEQMIALAVARLFGLGISTVSLTGKSPDKSVWRLFQKGDAQVFLGTIASGGVGIDLFAADTAIFLDRSWVHSDNDQAEDRLHRMGQKNAVHIIDYESRDTIDRYRKVKVETKRGWLKRMLGDV